MNHELIKRKVFDFVQRKRRQKDPVFQHGQGFAPIRVYETDTKDFKINFDELGEILLEIESESGDSLRVVNTVGIERIEFDKYEPSENVYLPPSKRLKYKEVRYYGLECKAEIKQGMEKPSTDKKTTFYITNTGKFYRVLKNGEEVSYQFRKGIKLEMLNYFIDNQHLKPSEFKDGLGKKYKDDYIRKEIIELRNLIAEKFEGIDSKDFIPDAIPGEGYRLAKGMAIKAKH